MGQPPYLRPRGLQKRCFALAKLEYTKILYSIYNHNKTVPTHHRHGTAKNIYIKFTHF